MLRTAVAKSVRLEDHRARLARLFDLVAAQLLGDREEDALLVIEVAVERAGADVRARDDVHHLRAVIAVLAEQILRGVEQLGARLVAALGLGLAVRKSFVLASLDTPVTQPGAPAPIARRMLARWPSVCAMPESSENTRPTRTAIRCAPGCLRSVTSRRFVDGLGTRGVCAAVDEQLPPRACCREGARQGLRINVAGTPFMRFPTVSSGCLVGRATTISS